MYVSNPTQTREAFVAASHRWLALLDTIDAHVDTGDETRTFGDLDREVPGATWTVRELVAHTLRAYTTIETYLVDDDGSDPGPDDGDPDVDLDIPDPAADIERVRLDAPGYYRQALAGADVHAGIVERARTGAQAMPDPVGEAQVVVWRVVALVESTADDTPVATPFGRLELAEYLVTRTVEVALHTIDLQRALGQPAQMDEVVAQAILPVLLELGSPMEMVLALTGRAPLPDGYDVLS